jgi:hypothetical protein
MYVLISVLPGIDTENWRELADDGILVLRKEDGLAKHELEYLEEQAVYLIGLN